MLEDFPKVYIIVLNWNGWKDTVECLESLLRLNYPNYQVVVVDNGSTDESVSKIKDWAEGKILAKPDISDERITKLIYPPVPKPVSLSEGTKESSAPLILLKTETNLGYAGGNNVGLRYALSRNDFGFVWILNNDVVVHPDALQHLVCRMKEKPEAGICGSSVLQYYNPDRIDSIGGSKYDRWFAQPVGLEGGKIFDFDHPEKYLMLEKRIDYVAGCSVFVSREFLFNVGLICEDYFLYFEEIDWALRARGRYSLAISPYSIVYHKSGRSIKEIEGAKKRRFSLVHDKYTTRNRLLFTSRYYPYALPILMLSIFGYILDRLLHGAWENAFVVAKEFVRPLIVKLRQISRFDFRKIFYFAS